MMFKRKINPATLKLAGKIIREQRELITAQKKVIASQKERIGKLNDSIWLMLSQCDANPHDVIAVLGIYTENAED